MTERDHRLSGNATDREPTELDEGDWDEVIDEQKTSPRRGSAGSAEERGTLDVAAPDAATIAREVVDALSRQSVPEIVPEEEELVAAPPSVRRQTNAGTPPPPPSVPRAQGTLPPPPPSIRPAAAPTLAMGMMTAGKAGTVAATTEQGLIEELIQRADGFDRKADALSASRTRMELGLVLEVARGDRVAALAEYVRSHVSAPNLIAPIVAARWLTPSRPVGPALALATDHLRVTRDQASRAERSVEVARLYQATGDVEQARAHYEQALGLASAHPSALRGLEGLLQGTMRKGDSQATEALAQHLERMAAAWTREAPLAAWLSVERSVLLERAGRTDAARAAMQEAIRRDGRSLLVRRALARQLSNLRDDEGLVVAWGEEAALESDEGRAARLEYAAGRLVSERLDDARRAIELHERAAARDGADVETRRSALRELARLHEAIGQPKRSAEAWQRLLAHIEHPAHRAYVHRRLSELFELMGDAAQAATHGEHFLQAEPDDLEARERVDRALEVLGQHERRVSFWAAHAAREGTPAQRADAFARAAAIAETHVRSVMLAQSMYRAAWAADPSHVDAFDGLARLLAPRGVENAEAIPPEVRVRIDLYEQAAVSAGDMERKLACLQTVATLYEELQLPARALEVYRRMIALDPSRRIALVGIQRAAARCKDYGELVAALVAEAELVQDPPLQRTLLLRASTVAAEAMGDPDRAVELIARILRKSPGDLVALRAAWRVNYRNSRHEEALLQLKQLLKFSRRGAPSFAVSAEMALLLEDRLHRNAEAVQAWREANRQDPAHPVPPAEICRLLIAAGNDKQAADDLLQMAERAGDAASKARLYAQAGEILDDRLQDLDGALAALQWAHANAPDDEAIFERLVRVLERRAKPGDLVALLEKRVAKVSSSTRWTMQYQLADLLAGERDYVRAAGLLTEVIASEPGNVAARRLLEQAWRRLENWRALAELLRAEADRATVPDVRASALWEVLFLEEHQDVGAPEGDSTLARLRRIQPSNPFVHEAILRASGLKAADAAQTSSLAESLSVAASAAGDPSTAAALDLASALVIERSARERGAPPTPEAMQRYRSCLAQWQECLAAARGLLRVAHGLGEELATMEAHAALGRIETDRTARAEHNAVAADMLLRAGAGDADRALALYGKALDEDPDQGRAVAGLMQLVQAGADTGRVVDILRTTLDRASSQVQVAAVGGALASLARERLRDSNVAIEALRRVRAKAPGHVPTLVSLAEAANDVQLWPEAVDAGRAALAIAQQPMDKLRALVSLAEAHAHQHDAWEDARREAVEAEVAAEAIDRMERLRVIERLERVYGLIGDTREHERLTCMAVALGGDDPAALRRLALLFRPDQVESAIGYVQAINRVMAMADLFGAPHRPAWLIELGRLEAGILGRPREGLDKLRRAIALEPHRVDSTIALADALAVLGAHDEALSELRQALSQPRPEPWEAGHVVAIMLAIGRSLQATGRTAQAVATEEILACFGYGSEDRVAALRARKLPEQPPAYGCLERTVIERSVAPLVGQGVALRVGLALEDLVSKLIPADPLAARLAPAARLTARSSHPLRLLADRLAQAFGSVAFDLAVDVPSLPTPRVVVGAPATVLLPVGYDRLPVTEQAAGLGRLLALVALGVPWVDQLSAAELDGLIIGALHAGRPGWDAGALPEAREQAASVWRQRVSKASSRKHRRALDELAEEASLEFDIEAWRFAVRAAGWRCAWLVSGDWIATFNHVWRTDAELTRVWGAQVVAATFGDPVLRDLLLWSTSPEATPLVRLLVRGS